MESCKLSRDLLIEILARLSVKTLMQFKCVCSFFYDLIKNDHDFINEHYKFSRAKNNCALLEFNSLKSPVRSLLHYLLYKESESETRCIYLDMPNTEIRYVKSCDGVLCLIVGKDDPSAVGGDMKGMISPGMIFDVFALNPSTREIKALPSITVPNKPPNIEDFLYIMFGFGMSKNMVWKIVMRLGFEDIKLRGDAQEIVMVCSQVGGSWNWRQIDAVPKGHKHYHLLNHSRDFYLKGKYYWLCFGIDQLIWFDMDDETFGEIKIPLECKTDNSDFITIMNDTIAIISRAYNVLGDESFINIWLMDENNSNITWHNHLRVHFVRRIYDYWTPIGIWNLGGQLLVFSGDREIRYNEILHDEELVFKDGSGPDLISIDLVTQEQKIICTSKVKKSAINIGMNLTGNARIISERNITKDKEWNNSNITWYFYIQRPYARDFHESLKFL